jgi:hypothetical protein
MSNPIPFLLADLRSFAPTLMGKKVNVAIYVVIRNAHKIWSQILKGKDHLVDLGIDGRIILKCVIRI